MDLPDDRKDSDHFRYPPKSERRLSVAGMTNLVFGPFPKTPAVDAAHHPETQ